MQHVAQLRRNIRWIHWPACFVRLTLTIASFRKRAQECKHARTPETERPPAGGLSLLQTVGTAQC